jgi:alkanesulfonate monooxygenase SsuD/methylene tetrahydromethanopterin reductase-like flavin-dependent oxidoreductase (luciferase family)
MLAITLPHVQAWNTWYEDFGNNVDGFAELNARISAAAREAGRDPGEIERSACVFVVLDPAAKERVPRGDLAPVEGPPERIAEHLRALSDAGADEAILVVSPITEASVRELGRVLAVLDQASE